MNKWVTKSFNLCFVFLCVLISTTLNAAPKSSDSVNSQSIRNVFLNQGYSEVAVRQTPYEEALLLVDASFGDKYYRPFMVDTGTSFTSIDPKVAKNQGFKLRDTGVQTGGADSGSMIKAYEVLIPKLNFGNFVIQNTNTITENASFIKIDPKPLAGKIGLDFLRKHSAILDLSSQRLYFKTEANSKKDNSYQAQLLAMGYKKLSLERAPTGHQLLLVSINNAKPARFLLDCGMTYTAVSLAYAKAKDLDLDRDDASVGTGSGGGEIALYSAYIHKFSINSLNWHRREIGAMDFSFIDVGVPLSGVVGVDWMMENKVIVDLANDALFVRA